MASAPNGALVVRTYKETPHYEAKWRDPSGTQLKKRLGKAWLERGPDGGWLPRRGRVRPGFLDEHRAYLEMARVIEESEDVRSRTTPEQRGATFDDAAAAWLEYVQYEKRVKPTTLARYQSMLRPPDKAKLPRTPKSGRNQPRSARIMREFGGRKLTDIGVGDVRRRLSSLDREDISARTVNVYRQVLHAIFEYAKREDSFGLRENPGRRDGQTPRRRRPASRDVRARGSLGHRRGGALEPSPHPAQIRLLRGDERRVAADQRPGRSPLHRRGVHGDAAWRALRPALGRRGSQGRLHRRLESHVRRPGDEHQVKAHAPGADRRPGEGRAETTGGPREPHGAHRLRLLPTRRRLT